MWGLAGCTVLLPWELGIFPALLGLPVSLAPLQGLTEPTVGVRTWEPCSGLGAVLIPGVAGLFAPRLSHFPFWIGRGTAVSIHNPLRGVSLGGNHSEVGVWILL